MAQPPSAVTAASSSDALPGASSLGLEAGADKDALAHGHGGHGSDGTRLEAWSVVLVALAMVALPTLGAVVRRLTGNSLAFTLTP